MPIISAIGRKSSRVRLLVASIYTILIAGVLAMIYPFLLLLSGSTKSAVDAKNLEPWPKFFSDDRVLYQKHIEGLFNESLDAMNMIYDADFSSFEKVVPPLHPNEKLVEAWTNFLADVSLPSYAFTCGYLQAGVSKTVPSALRNFKQRLEKRFGPRMEDVNRALGTDFAGWNAFFVLPENFLSRRSMPTETPFAREINAFLNQQYPGHRYYFSLEGYYKRLFLKTQYTKDIAEYNQSHHTAYASYDEVHLSRALPAGTLEEKTDWETFLRSSLNLLWIQVDALALPVYRDYLRAKYDSVSALNQRYGTSYASFGEIPLVTDPPLEGIVLSDWDGFVSGWKDPARDTLFEAPVEALHIRGTDFLFQDYLQNKFGNVEALNQKCGTRFRNFFEVFPPQRDLHFEYFAKERRALRIEFATRNYKTVVDYMVLHGRGILNTVIYCFWAVLASLVVNPLAAYALSRFKMRSTYAWLLFLMLTMAFPPMVTQIPIFLMLRHLNLLNTFAALVLPTLANGYSIFLLKGFFDAQPRELYESAAMDGANEWVIFRVIAMSLSKPILAVIALNAFVHAYSNFLFALLICQDEKMWTLMVWLYQLQQTSGPPVVYASLMLAAIPTFVVFMLCQRVIIRGIVVPVEK